MIFHPKIPKKIRWPKRLHDKWIFRRLTLGFLRLPTKSIHTNPCPKGLKWLKIVFHHFFACFFWKKQLPSDFFGRICSLSCIFVETQQTHLTTAMPWYWQLYLASDRQPVDLQWYELCDLVLATGRLCFFVKNPSNIWIHFLKSWRYSRWFLSIKKGVIFSSSSGVVATQICVIFHP